MSEEKKYLDPEEGTIYDGLTLFIGQGKWALDASTDDTKYVVDVYRRKPECEDLDTFYNITYMGEEGGLFVEQFDKVRRESFSTRSDMLMFIGTFMTEHNHF